MNFTSASESLPTSTDKALDSTTRAFLPYPPVEIRHAAHGPLVGLSFAVKDIFDVAGYPTGAGNPHVLVRSGIKATHAPPVAALLAAGARFVGKTVTDELAFSALGSNVHFGTPINGGAFDRITGGSSSGSASAVSNGQCDIALGSDTGGSVRGPASHCGLYGIRPSQGRISLEGCFPLCPTFDTCGFFARDAETFARAAEVLLGDDDIALPAFPTVPRVLIAADLFALLAPEVREALQPAIAAIEAAWGEAMPVAACKIGATETPEDAARLYEAYRVLQGWEAWRMQGERIENDGLCLGPDVAARFAFSRSVTKAQAAAAQAVRQAFTESIAALLGREAILIVPTQPDIAPLRTVSSDDIERYRNRATHLMGLTPLCGMPQVSLPFAGREGAPLGISIIGPSGSDLGLVKAIAALPLPEGAIVAAGAMGKSRFQQATGTGQTMGAWDEHRVGGLVSDGKPMHAPDPGPVALAWYAQHMAGASIPAADLAAVTALAPPVAATVRAVAGAHLDWTDASQTFGAHLMRLAEDAGVPVAAQQGRASSEKDA
jgi:amidase